MAVNNRKGVMIAPELAATMPAKSYVHLNAPYIR
jgi:hypothetical protein